MFTPTRTEQLPFGGVAHYSHFFPSGLDMHYTFSFYNDDEVTLIASKDSEGGEHLLSTYEYEERTHGSYII